LDMFSIDLVERKGRQIFFGEEYQFLCDTLHC